MPQHPRAAPALRDISVSRTGLEEILLFREMHRQEISCQIIHERIC